MCSTQRVTEEKLEASSRRLELLEEQLSEREKEMEDANLQRTILQKDVQMLKQNVKGRKRSCVCFCEFHLSVHLTESTSVSLCFCLQFLLLWCVCVCTGE